MAALARAGEDGAATAPTAGAAPHGLADPAAVQALLEGRHGDPFALLGLHGGGPDGAPLVVRTFQPGAHAVRVVSGDALVAELDRTHPAGFFEGAIPRRRERFPYALRVADHLGERLVEDPYRFPPVLGELDVHLMAEGNHLELYRRLGAHPGAVEGVPGTAFAVWAPNARRVSVVGPFNGWDGRRHPMRRRVEAGVFELFVPEIGAGELYKYEIVGPHGELLPLKADPVAFEGERPPFTASVVRGLPEHGFNDREWMARRGAADPRERPISVYEVHPGSWRRVPEEGDRQLTWDEMGERLVAYATDMGFTHVEFLPVGEHPFEGSWGYQPIGLFAPSSRFGDPAGFARFVDKAHQAGLGVIVDWVPGHFPTDVHGLARFDGTALYEHEDPRLGFQPDWNTLVYNFGRREVANFLWSNALYWLERFHVDGLRVDAVASMLYLDYSRGPGQWIPNRFGGRENLEAVDFLRRLNELTYGRQPGSMTLAEESTAWPSVSRPVYLGGLGFGFKWNMGWMHDTLRFMQQDPIHRRFHMANISFGLVYAFSENFMLPLSHDEVVHGKGSLINKMPGDVWQKFANLRAYYGFMWTHPGKKLLFMGGEFGQWREWNHDTSLDWHLLDEGPFHRGLRDLVRDLNRLYRATPALHERDCEAEGFEWVDWTDADQCVVAFLRKGRDPGHVTLAVVNFTPVPRHGYRVGVPRGGLWREALNTDAADYGGSGLGNGGLVEAQAVASHGRPASLELTLPPLATLVLEPV